MPEKTTADTGDVRPDYYKVKCAVRNQETGLYVILEVECFDLIDALFKGHPAAFYLGNALKYLFRVGRKPPEEASDLLKVSTYAKQAIERGAK